jgi:hypothetical protein
MAMSLIHPNQMRHCGLVVSDDPTDHDRVFGITGDDFTIPFDISGTTVFFPSRAPTRRELETHTERRDTAVNPFWRTETQKDEVSLQNYLKLVFCRTKCIARHDVVAIAEG